MDRVGMEGARRETGVRFHQHAGLQQGGRGLPGSQHLARDRLDRLPRPVHRGLMAPLRRRIRPCRRGQPPLKTAAPTAGDSTATGPAASG